MNFEENDNKTRKIKVTVFIISILSMAKTFMEYHYKHNLGYALEHKLAQRKFLSKQQLFLITRISLV